MKQRTQLITALACGPLLLAGSDPASASLEVWPNSDVRRGRAIGVEIKERMSGCVAMATHPNPRRRDRLRGPVLDVRHFSDVPLARRANRPPTLDRLDATHLILSHGRVDVVRPISATNPNGLGSQLPGFGTGSGVPGAVPGATALFDVIAAQPNRNLITLDDDGDGNADATNVVVTAAAGMPSCFSLIVAEGLNDPDGDPVGMRWTPPAVRFGAGNLYATVPFTSADGTLSIFPGMELVTQAQYELYTANSVVWEAPDVGFIIQDAMLDGGASGVAGRAIDFPVDPAEQKLSQPSFTKRLGYASPLELTIQLVDQTEQNGTVRTVLRANVGNNFDPPANRWFRWAVEGRKTTIIRDVAVTNVFAFDLDAHDEGGGSVRVTCVGSSKGPQAANPNPFVTKLPQASVGTTTFLSAGATLSDTESVRIPPASANGGGNGTVTKSICILLDASSSMGQDHRMEQAKESARRVLQRMGNDTEVALIVFYGCGDIRVEHPFTTDAPAIVAILQGVQPSGSTPLAAATTFAKNYIRKNASGQSAELVILTDGKETCGGDPIEAARSGGTNR